MKAVQVRNIELGDGVPKIAVPVVGSTMHELRKEISDARCSFSDLIEIRADSVTSVKSVKEWIEIFPLIRAAAGEKALLFTWRSAREGGSNADGDTMYDELLTAAIESGRIDIIDIEQESKHAAELIEKAKKQKVRTIISWHSFSDTPSADEMRARLRAMAETDADILKIACMPTSRRDVMNLLSVSAEWKLSSEKPFILISMGENGQAARLSVESYGSALTFGCLDGKSSAPGQMSVSELRENLDRIHRNRSQRGHLFLTGFMGTGKSSVARELGLLTGRNVFELDERIAQREGSSIPDIFREKGEEYFRDLESMEIAGLYDEESAIISCGGGAVLREGNRAFMKCLGKNYLLTAEPQTLLERLTGESEGRPNIRDRMTEEGIEELLAARREYYELAADDTVATDQKTVREIAEMILRN